MSEQNTDVKSLAHTKWNCKYHVVFSMCQVIVGSFFIY